MNIKYVLKTTFISFLALLATLQTNAQDSLYTKFYRKINDAHRFDNPDWVRDISEATSIAIEIAKTQNNYREIVEVGNFLLEVKDYKNALTFLEFAAINKEMLAWCDIARMHYEGLGVPKDIKKGNKLFEKGLEYCKGFICVDDGIYLEQIQGFYQFPIKYEIKSLPNPQSILKNFEDCGYTFNVKESKEYLFRCEVKEGYRYACYLPITLTPEQVEKSKDRPYLVPEAHVVRLFSYNREKDSHDGLLLDVETIKKKLKVMCREAGETNLFFKTNQNPTFPPEYFYKYLGELSNGLQLIFCIYYPCPGTIWGRHFIIAGFQAKKIDGTEAEIDITFMDFCQDEPEMSFFYVENDTLVELKYDYSLVFHTCLSEDEFRKTKLNDMLKKIEEERKNAKMKRKRITPSMN